jgi:hypothetical protein
MSDSASDIVLSRLLRQIDRAAPAELPALTQEFARLKPPASPQLGEDYVSPEKKVIAKIVSQDDKLQALHELAKLANLGAPNPEDSFSNRHSLSVPAAQAWGTLIETVPSHKDRVEMAIEAMTFAQVDVMKDVAAVALLNSLTKSPVLGPIEAFGLKQVQAHALESHNALLGLMIRDFYQTRVQTLAAENARQQSLPRP